MNCSYKASFSFKQSWNDVINFDGFICRRSSSNAFLSISYRGEKNRCFIRNQPSFQALHAEDHAHRCFEQAQRCSTPATQLCSLDRATEALLQARQYWSDVILALEVQSDNLHIASDHRQLAIMLLSDVWQERVRITALLLHIEQAQAACQQDCSPARARSKRTGKDQ